jgi:hypothetical protein
VAGGRVRSFLVFFYWRQAAKNKKMALVLIEFSGASLHGE